MSSREPETEALEWLQAEASQQTLRRELQRLKRRAKKKIVVVILLSLLGVAAVVKKVSGRIPMYQATILMRVTEGNLLEEDSPMANEGLADYLYSVALNSERLTPIVEKHNLYPERKTFGPLYAVEKIRDFLDIEITANYFARVRDEGDPQRSVGINLHFSDFDPDLAFEVAQDLGAALIDAERERRAKHAEKLSAIANRTVVMVETKLTALNASMNEAMRTVERGPIGADGALKIAEAKIAMRRLAEDLKQTTLVMESMSANRDYIELAKAAEGAEQALRFDIIDVRRPFIAPKTSKIFYAVLGLFVFIMLVPVCAIGVAAMDSKLHGIEDVMRLNMPVVGHLPHFPSDRMGSLRDRSRKRKDVA